MKIHYHTTVISVAFFVLWACTTQENKPNADPAGYEPTTSQDISFLDKIFTLLRHLLFGKIEK